MSMLRMYDLLPEVYHEMDTNGELRVFLDTLQARFAEWYDDEAILRTVQSIEQTPPEYLKYIARSLGWVLQSQTDEERRNETAMIVDFYDLKGTPYAINLISSLSFGPLYKGLGEFWTPTPESASDITTSPTSDLAELLNNDGEFVYEDWNDEGTSDYHYDPLYSYFVFVVVDPEDYAFGSVTPRFKKFFSWLHQMHPAGRFCYVYVMCRGWRTEHYMPLQLLWEELTGLKAYDDLGYFDDGGSFDEEDEPIHESLSTIFRIEWEYFDDAGFLDDDGFLDDGQWEVHGLVEIA